MRRHCLSLILALLLSGCAVSPTPRAALERALAEPEIARWYAAHSSPTITRTMTPKEAKRWRRYHPAATVDLQKEWLQIRLDADFGPEPRHLEALVNRTSGSIFLRPQHPR